MTGVQTCALPISCTEDAIGVHYYGKIASAQRKLRNTTDSLVRPIKALDIFKNIDKYVEYILGTEADFKVRQNIADYYMFHGMEYEKAKEVLGAYIKDIVLQKNDINNWTTKMEVELLGTKKGLKYSKSVLCALSDVIFGDLSDETVRFIENADSGKLSQNREFLRKLANNNKIMRARFLSLNNPLLKSMTVEDALGGFIHSLKDKSLSGNSAVLLQELLQDKIADLGTLTAQNGERLLFKRLQNCQNILKAFASGMAFEKSFEIEPAIKYLREAGGLGFNSSNKVVAEISGKNITDFFASAAQSVRSRNKWLKLIYSLLGGTLVVSALTILFMGRKNNLNPHIYEKKDSSKGVLEQ